MLTAVFPPCFSHSSLPWVAAGSWPVAAMGDDYEEWAKELTVSHLHTVAVE